MLGSEQIGTLITALGTGIGHDEFNARQAALSQDHHHDGRRRRRRAYPHAAADVLLSGRCARSIDRGHLYIAQPPLYKVDARQVRSSICKDERALEDYPDRDRRSKTRCCGSQTGEERAGARPAERWSRKRATSATCSTACTSRYSRDVVEQAAILGVLNAGIIGDPGKGQGRRAVSSRERLDVLAEETERGWDGTFIEGDRLSCSSAPCAA